MHRGLPRLNVVQRSRSERLHRRRYRRLLCEVLEDRRLLSPTSAEPIFSPGSVIGGSGGSHPNSVAVGDFNGDGKPDLVLANSDSNNVGVLLNDGAGGFGAAVTYACGGSNPFAVAVGDFNTDGKLDLAVANYNSKDVGILLAKEGGFGAAVTYPSGGNNPWSLAVDDFNADGKPDLVVANRASHNIGVIVNSGSGSFVPTVSYGSGGEDPYSVAVGDFNADGKSDIAVANATTSDVGILLGNGDGGFASVAMYPSGQYYPHTVSVGDFNADEKPDIAVVNELGNNVGILLRNGAGGFDAVVEYRCGGTGPRDLAVADFNADGKLDVAVPNNLSNNVGILLNTGTGRFDTALTYSSGGTSPRSIAVGDFNADGEKDLAVANYADGTVAILLNVFDPGDTLDHADDLGTLAAGTPVVRADQIGNGRYGNKDVDLYKLTLEQDNNVDIQVTTFEGKWPPSDFPLDAYVRLLDSGGDEIQVGDAMFETDPEGARVWGGVHIRRLPQAGTYYIGVSGKPNTAYDPNVAESRVDGSSGTYRLVVADTVEFAWQYVRVADPDSNSENPTYNQYAVKARSREVPPDPSTTVYPTVVYGNSQPDREYEPVQLRLVGPDGELDADAFPELARKVLAYARNAALYRSWARGVSTPGNPLGDTFQQLAVTTPFSTPSGSTAGGGTDTRFEAGVDSYPGYLWLPREYLTLNIATPLIDLTFLDWAKIGQPPIGRPVGIKDTNQRTRLYEQLLQGFLLQDALPEMQESSARDFITLLEQNKVALENLANTREEAERGEVLATAKQIGDFVLAIKGKSVSGEGIKFALQQTRPFNGKQMAWISEALGAQNHYTGWALRAAPWVDLGLSAALRAWERETDLQADIWMATIQANSAMAHGKDILEALRPVLFSGQGEVSDPALKTAFENVSKAFSKEGVEAYYQAFFSKLREDRKTEYTLDDVELVLNVAATAATVVSGGTFALFAGAVYGLFKIGRTIGDYLAARYEQEETQQSVVLASTLLCRWVDHPFKEAVGDFDTIPTEKQIDNVNWLMSTYLYSAAYVADKAFAPTGDWLFELLNVTSEIKRYRDKYAGLRVDVVDAFLGDVAANGDTPMVLRDIAGTEYVYRNDQRVYHGCVPEAKLDTLVRLLSPTSVQVGKSIRYRMHSPGVMGIVDPAGRRVGTFSVRGSDGAGGFVDLNEIPGATDTGREVEPREITIPDPIFGEYAIQMVGTGSGEYTLDVESWSGDSVLSSEHATGSFNPGGRIEAVSTVSVGSDGFEANISAQPVVFGTLQGVGRDATTGAVLAGMTVKAGSEISVTGDDGQYALMNVEPGNVTVTASLYGYDTFVSDPMVLPAGQSLSLDISLRDIAAPSVALSFPVANYGDTPMATVTAVDNNVLPDGAVVVLDVDLNNDEDFADTGETAYSLSTLTDGSTTFEVTPALAEGTYRFRARVHDQATNEGRSKITTLIVDMTAAIPGR